MARKNTIRWEPLTPAEMRAWPVDLRPHLHDLNRNQPGTMEVIDRLRAPGGPKAHRMLIRLLSHPDSFVRQQAAVRLGKSGRKSAAGPLLALFRKEPDPHVRVHVAYALGELAHPMALPTLIRNLDAQGYRKGDAASAAIALGYYLEKKPDSKPAIQAALRLLRRFVPDGYAAPTELERTNTVKALEAAKSHVLRPLAKSRAVSMAQLEQMTRAYLRMPSGRLKDSLGGCISALRGRTNPSRPPSPRRTLAHALFHADPVSYPETFRMLLKHARNPSLQNRAASWWRHHVATLRAFESRLKNG